MRTLIIIFMLCAIGSGATQTQQMCRNKTYRAEIDKWATSGETQISLVVQPLIMPPGAIFNGDSYPDRYVIEYSPDSDQDVTFKFLITFDPNVCIEPPTRIWERTYQIVEPIPAPEVPIRPFVVVE